MAFLDNYFTSNLPKVIPGTISVTFCRHCFVLPRGGGGLIPRYERHFQDRRPFALMQQRLEMGRNPIYAIRDHHSYLTPIFSYEEWKGTLLRIKVL